MCPELGNRGCGEPRGANASPVCHPASPALIYSPWEGARKGFPILLVGFIVEMLSGSAGRGSQTLGSFSSPREQACLAGDSAPGSCHRSLLVIGGGGCMSEQP